MVVIGRSLRGNGIAPERTLLGLVADARSRLRDTARCDKVLFRTRRDLDIGYVAVNVASCRVALAGGGAQRGKVRILRQRGPAQCDLRGGFPMQLGKVGLIGGRIAARLG